MKRRVLILPVAAAIILALVLYRLRREERPSAARAAPAMRRLAPRFELYDQSNRLVKFERYLGRTRIVLLFVDGDPGADADPLLVQLVEHEQALRRAGVQVVAVSRATPYENQQAAERLGEEFPFPLLTDIDPTQPIPAPVHQMWGLFHPEGGGTEAALFLIDRDGSVRWEDGRPVPAPDPATVVDELIAGSWPEGG